MNKRLLQYSQKAGLQQLTRQKYIIPYKAKRYIKRQIKCSW